MSDHHNQLGFRGLGLSLENNVGTVYPQLTAMWAHEEGNQRQVSRGMASRGAEGTAKRLVAIVRDPDRDQQVRRRINSLLERWAEERGRDRAVIEAEW